MVYAWEVEVFQKDEYDQSQDFPSLPKEQLIHAVVLGRRLMADTHNIYFAIHPLNLHSEALYHIPLAHHHHLTGPAYPPDHLIILHCSTPALGLIPPPLTNTNDTTALEKDQSFQIVLLVPHTAYWCAGISDVLLHPQEWYRCSHQPRHPQVVPHHPLAQPQFSH